MSDFEIKPIKVTDTMHKYNKDLPACLFKLPFRLSIIGPSNCGKTVFLIRLLEFYIKHSKIEPKDIFIYNPTFSLGNNEEKYKLLELPKENVFEQLPHEEHLKELIKERTEKKHPWILILDDCAGKSTHKNRELDELIFKIRHSLGSLILISQKYNALSTSIRTNCSHYVFFNTQNKKERKIISNELQGDLDDNEFDKMYNFCCCKPYSFMIIDLTMSNPKHRFRDKLNQVVCYKND